MCSTIIKQYPCYIVAGYTFGSLSQFYTWWQTSLNLVWSKPLISLGLTVVLRFSGKLFCQIIECYVIYIQFFSKCSVLNNNELCLLLFHTRKLYARTLLHYTVMHLHSPNQQSKIQFFIFWLLSFKSLQFLFRITLINKFVFMVTWIESQCAKKNKRAAFFSNLFSLLQFVQRLGACVLAFVGNMVDDSRFIDDLWFNSDQNNIQRQRKINKNYLSAQLRCQTLFSSLRLQIDEWLSAFESNVCVAARPVFIAKLKSAHTLAGLYKTFLFVCIFGFFCGEGRGG